MAASQTIKVLPRSLSGRSKRITVREENSKRIIAFLFNDEGKYSEDTTDPDLTLVEVPPDLRELIMTQCRDGVVDLVALRSIC